MRVREYLRLRALAFRQLGTAEGVQTQRQMDALYATLTREELREVKQGCRIQDGAP